MPHLISYAVVRQSMKWLDLPQPIAMFGEPPIDFGEHLQQYVTLQFLGIQVRRRYDYSSLYDHSPAFEKFLSDLGDSFCSDILPVEASYEVATDLMTVKLSCTLWKQATQRQLL